MLTMKPIQLEILDRIRSIPGRKITLRALATAMDYSTATISWHVQRMIERHQIPITLSRGDGNHFERVYILEDEKTN